MVVLMIIFEKGGGSVNLTKNDFVASGGEGSIYAKGKTAYKIYADPKKMIPTPKIQELEVITDPKVIRPLHILLDKKNKEIGYSMRYLQDNHPLCQIFTKSFKDRNNISPDTILKLVQDMQKTVKHIHNKGVLIVDLNEMNFLVDKKFKEVYFIDVDSYQTKSYPATALMESVRDRHATRFTQGSDWFAFAVVSFQLFIGIHPYKGRYTELRGMVLEDRMQSNFSVFNKHVRIPKICSSFDVMPRVYQDWYFKVFEEGYRESPPFDLNAKIKVVYKVNKIKGNDKFVITEIKKVEADIIDYMNPTLLPITKTNDGTVYVDNFKHQRPYRNTVISMTPKHNQAIETRIGDDGLLYYYNLSLRKDIRVGNGTTLAKSIMGYDGRAYAQSGTKMLELQFSGKDDMMASSKIVGNILEKSTKMYDGLVIQNLMGTYYASIFPKLGTCYQIPLEELKNQKIVDAKFDGFILMVIVHDGRRYNKIIYRLNSSYKIRDVRTEHNISIIDLNFVCLPNNIVAHINNDENLELFSTAGGDIKQIDSDTISSDIKLFKNGTNVYFSKGNILYRMATK